jgi:hypothetical protein
MLKLVRLLLLVLIISLSLLSYWGNQKVAMAENKVELQNIYNYKHEDIKSFLNNIKPNENYAIQKIVRNSSGTSLYIQYSANNIGNKFLIIPTNGQIKEIDAPAKVVYFDDNGDVVAWSNNLSKDIHFRNGKFRDMMKSGEYGSGVFCIDLSGRYFAIEVQPGIMEIAGVEKPNQAIFQTKLTVNKIFVTKDKIYLFDYDNENYGKKHRHEKIICQIFKKNSSGYKLEDEFNILRPSARPSPFFVVDMDLESEKVLVEDVRDNPLSFLTSCYLFDIKTKSMHKIERMQGNYTFFLKEDILRKRRDVK